MKGGEGARDGGREGGEEVGPKVMTLVEPLKILKYL